MESSKYQCQVNGRCDKRECIDWKTCIKKDASVIFNELDDNEIELLNKNSVFVQFKPGEIIYKENIKTSGVYCLYGGKAKIIKNSPKENDVIVGLKKSVDFLDIESFITRQKHTNTAVAVEDSLVCIIEETLFKRMLKTNFKFTQRMLKQLATTIISNCNHYINTTQKQIRARIADTLLELKTLCGVNDDGYIDIVLKRQDIAAMSGVTLSNVIRIINSLEKDNIIECHKKQIKILDTDRLKEISSAG